MFCRKCGKKLDSQDRFCNICGEPVLLEADSEATVVPEPPKDLVWNIEGFPKDKKVEDVIFDWKIDSQGEDFVVDEFYINENKNVSAQKLLDQELEKINRNNIAREEAVLAAQAIAAAQTVSTARRIFSEEIKNDLEKTAKKTEIEQAPVERTTFTSENLSETETAASELQEATTSESQSVAASELQEVATSDPQSVASDIETLNVPNKTELKYEDIFVEEEEEPKRKGFSFGKFLLVLLIILIILEGVFLGFKYYMPDNQYFKIVDSKVTQAVLTVESWFLVKEPAAEPTKSEKPVVEKPIAEEPANLFPENKNIKEVSMNPDLIYVSGKDYGTADINQSLPVIESTDQVMNTIVEYDSKWIDFVNNGDKGVLDLTASGSPAEKNALNFTKAGEIKETFNFLEMGEVRKGSKGYYIWVREEIEILENNLTTTKVYNWIYLVTPVENQMKIVNYFSYN